MRTRIITAVIAIAVFFGVTASAQTDDNTSCCHARKECTHSGKKCDAKGRKSHKTERKDAFDGISLSDSQKTQLEAIKPDTAKRAGFRQIRRDYVKGVKKILTPEQYTLFLENIVIDNAQIKDIRTTKNFRHGQLQKAKAFKRGNRDLQNVKAEQLRTTAAKTAAQPSTAEK